MAVTVLKLGHRNKVACDYCDSELSYTIPDIQLETQYMNVRDSYNKKYILCPVCKNRIYIGKEKYRQ